MAAAQMRCMHKQKCFIAGAPRRRACPRPSQRSVAAKYSSVIVDAQEAKCDLLEAVYGTNRGAKASKDKRGYIEELQVAVESAQGSTDLNYDLLGGLWQLQYTTATDVLPILGVNDALRNPIGPNPLQVGNIYQRFTTPVDGSGKVDNVIQLSVPFLLEENQGVTITVQASYEVRSGHRIQLAFDGAMISDVRISAGLEALLAPAILPRGPLQHALLLAIKQFQVRFPFRSAAQVVAGVSNNVSNSLAGTPAAGGGYQLTYLDEDMLIGRAVSLGGSFIFTRAQ